MVKIQHSILYPFIYNKAMRSLYFVFILILASCSLSNQEILFDGQRALLFVEEQMAFGPRIPGSDASGKTAGWIVERLEADNWEVEIQRFRHMGIQLTNIVAKLDGQGEGKPILIGAHFDTRPFADQDIDNLDSPVPGANDGASGVAILIELAHVLDSRQLNQPVWLAFFDGEDSGNIGGWDWIVGSSFFADNLSEGLEAAVIVDMVGDQDLQLFIEKNSDPSLVQEIWKTADQLGYKKGFINTPKYSMIDDHLPFLKIGVPAVDIIDFDYPYWHTTSDTVDKLSADSLEQVGRTLERWLENRR